MIDYSSSTLPRLALLLGLALSTSVLAQGTVNDYYEDAQRYYNWGDPRTALVQLKKALEQDDQHIPSLILAGDIYLEMGDAPAAEISYGESLLLGADAGYVTPRIAETYAAQNKYRKILDELNPALLKDNGKTELLGYRAIAQLMIKEQAASEETIRQALAINPESRVPNIARVQILLRAGMPGKAQGITTMLTDRYPFDAQCWHLHAAALNAQGLEPDALAAYTRAVELNPYLTSARLALAALQLAAGQAEAASAHVDFVREHLPGDPRGAYMKALLLERDGENALALEEYRQASQLLSLIDVDVVAENIQLTIMGAISHIRLGELQRARTYVEAYNSRDRDNQQVGQMLASLLIEEGDAAAAMAVLNRLITAAPDDPGLLSLKARAQKHLGRFDQATATWQALVKRGYGTIDVDAQIALSQLMAGDAEAGIEGLESVLQRDNTRIRETFLLANTYLRTGHYGRAVDLARQLIKLAPLNPEFQDLLGRCYMFNGELELARQVLAAAAVTHPDFLPVLINLAKVETARGDLGAARNRLMALSSAHPDSGAVMLQLSRVERLSGDLPKARKWAENATLSNADWFEPREFLARLLLELGEAAEAEILAREISVRLPENMEARFLLAKVLVAVGKPRQARSTYQLMARRALADHELLYRIARQQVKLGLVADASNTLYRAISAKPDSFKYREAYIRVTLNLENYQAALQLASELIEDFPGNAVAHARRARAHVGLGQVSEAVEQFVIARRADPENRALLLEQYRGLTDLGEVEKAEQALTAWLADIPGDQLVNAAYSGLLIDTGRWPEAQSVLSAMLKKPGNPLLLNNLAYVLQEMGRPEAIEIARQAQTIAPHLPQINDTLGWILVRNAQAQEGLVYLREAAARGSEDPSIRYHLAVALNDLGRPSEAVRELKRALSHGDDFDGRGDAVALLSAIE